MVVTAAVISGAGVAVALLGWDAFRRWLVVYRERTAHVDGYEKAVERLAKDVQTLKNEKAAAALGRR